MGPGPSDLYPEVMSALGLPGVGHLDPVFIELMDSIKAAQRAVFQTESAHSFTISAPASAAMEAGIGNLVEPGDEVLVCINGVFGGRMAEMARRHGAKVHEVTFPWGQPVDPERVGKVLEDHTLVKLVAFVHAETSTGVRSDAAGIAAVARRHDCLTLMDTVTGLGGIPVAMDEWGLDVVFSGSQKCLSCVPGVAPLMVSEKAWDRIRARRSPPVSWFLDLQLLAGYWEGQGRRAYHHTAPVSAMYAWHAALARLLEEGLEAAWQRHRELSDLLGRRLAALGLERVVDSRWALPQLTVVGVPEECTDEAAVRSRLLNEFDLEIGAGLGAWAGKVWRIGLMGHSCREENVARCSSALAAVLGRPEPGKASDRDEAAA